MKFKCFFRSANSKDKVQLIPVCEVPPNTEPITPTETEKRNTCTGNKEKTKKCKLTNYKLLL